MAKFHFDLVSPERLLMSAEVVQVDVPGSEGDFGVLAGHAPVIATLKPGVVTVKGHGSEDERIFVRGGFAEVNLDGLTILAEHDATSAKAVGQVAERWYRAGREVIIVASTVGSDISDGIRGVAA